MSRGDKRERDRAKTQAKMAEKKRQEGRVSTLMAHIESEIFFVLVSTGDTRRMKKPSTTTDYLLLVGMHTYIFVLVWYVKNAHFIIFHDLNLKTGRRCVEAQRKRRGRLAGQGGGEKGGPGTGRRSIVDCGWTRASEKGSVQQGCGLGRFAFGWLAGCEKARQIIMKQADDIIMTESDKWAFAAAPEQKKKS